MNLLFQITLFKNYMVKLNINGEVDFMEKIKIALCDDEPSVTEKTKNYVATYLLEHSINHEFHIFQDGSELLHAPYDFDIAILDIDMKHIGGIEVKEALDKGEWRTKIIFLSNYDMYMEDSFGRDVYGFIRKDQMEKLIPYLKKIMHELINNQCIILLNTVYPINDIIYITANGNYVNLICTDEIIMVRMQLSDVLAELDDRQFMLVHRSHVVNFKHVKSLVGETIYLENTSTTIPISRRKKKLFHEKCLAYARWRNEHD